jgi:hypothetical protein
MLLIPFAAALAVDEHSALSGQHSALLTFVSLLWIG